MMTLIVSVQNTTPVFTRTRIEIQNAATFVKGTVHEQVINAKGCVRTIAN